MIKGRRLLKGVTTALWVILISSLAVGLSALVMPLELESLATAASVALAPLTFALVGLTGVLAMEARATRISNLTPHVIVTLEPSKYVMMFNLVIQNVGSGPAYNVRISSEPDISFDKSNKKTNFSEINLTSIPVLKPEQRIETFVSRYTEIEPKTGIFNIKWEDKRGFSGEDANSFNVLMYEGTGKIDNDSLEKIARSLDKIERALSNTTTSRRLQVDVYNREDRRAEQAEIPRLWREEERLWRDLEAQERLKNSAET